MPSFSPSLRHRCDNVTVLYVYLNVHATVRDNGRLYQLKCKWNKTPAKIIVRVRRMCETLKKYSYQIILCIIFCYCCLVFVAWLGLAMCRMCDRLRYIHLISFFVGLFFCSLSFSYSFITQPNLCTVSTFFKKRFRGPKKSAHQIWRACVYSQCGNDVFKQNQNGS